MSFLIPPNEAQFECIKKDDAYRTPAKLEEDITQLIEWLSKQPHLPNVTDREWLLHFIIGCKYSLQKSKHVIELYFIARAEHPEYYGSYTEEELKEATFQGMMSLCPKLTPEGYRVLCMRTVPLADDYKFNVRHFVKGCTSLLDLQMKEEPVYGNIVVFDLKHFRTSDFMVFTPTVTKNMFKCFVESFPLRSKSIHYVNPPMFISAFVTFFKMFLSKKLKERLFVHDSLESLYQYIPKEILPDIYGGSDGTIEQNEKNTIELLLMKNNKWLEERPKADMSKKPRHTNLDDLGVNGTFKKLQID